MIQGKISTLYLSVIKYFNQVVVFIFVYFISYLFHQILLYRLIRIVQAVYVIINCIKSVQFTTPPGLDTPVELKLKLIPMLQHMHHDASLASSSRDLLQHLVSSYPSTPMVIVTLHTFTQLAASSLIDIPKQVCYYNVIGYYNWPFIRLHHVIGSLLLV